METLEPRSLCRKVHVGRVPIVVRADQQEHQVGIVRPQNLRELAEYLPGVRSGDTEVGDLETVGTLFLVQQALQARWIRGRATTAPRIRISQGDDLKRLLARFDRLVDGQERAACSCGQLQRTFHGEKPHEKTETNGR